MEHNGVRSTQKTGMALVTGAGSGLGRQLALTLAADGMAVAGIDLHPEPLAALAEEMKGKPFAWAVGDVTDRAALGSAVAQVQEQLGPIDLLIANAGIGMETPAVGFRGEDFETIIRVNLIGVANSIEAVLPGMLERGRGHLVGISSLASYRGLPPLAGYCASKAGVRSLMEALRVELNPLGIAVTTICPGWIRTPMTAQIDTSNLELMEVADAARLIVGAIRKRRPFFAFPPSIRRRVWLLRFLPTRASDWLARKLLRPLKKQEEVAETAVRV